MNQKANGQEVPHMPGFYDECGGINQAEKDYISGQYNVIKNHLQPGIHSIVFGTGDGPKTQATFNRMKPKYVENQPILVMYWSRLRKARFKYSFSDEDTVVEVFLPEDCEIPDRWELIKVPNSTIEPD